MKKALVKTTTKLSLLIIVCLMLGCSLNFSASSANQESVNKTVPTSENTGKMVENTAKNPTPKPTTDAKIEEEYWLGKYEYCEMWCKANSQLIIKRQGDKLIGAFRRLDSATVMEKFSITVEVQGNTASLYFKECLPLVDDEVGSENFCQEVNFEKGDLMFRLVKKAGKNKFATKEEKIDPNNLVKVNRFEYRNPELKF